MARGRRHRIDGGVSRSGDPIRMHAALSLSEALWCPLPDSNRHALGLRILSPTSMLDLIYKKQ